MPQPPCALCAHLLRVTSCVGGIRGLAFPARRACLCAVFCKGRCASRAYFALFSLIAACAAARRAIGTRKGEQET